MSSEIEQVLSGFSSGFLRTVHAANRKLPLTSFISACIGPSIPVSWSVGPPSPSPLNEYCVVLDGSRSCRWTHSPFRYASSNTWPLTLYSCWIRSSEQIDESSGCARHNFVAKLRRLAAELSRSASKRHSWDTRPSRPRRLAHVPYPPSLPPTVVSSLCPTHTPHSYALAAGARRNTELITSVVRCDA